MPLFLLVSYKWATFHSAERSPKPFFFAVTYVRVCGFPIKYIDRPPFVIVLGRA